MPMVFWAAYFGVAQAMWMNLFRPTEIDDGKRAPTEYSGEVLEPSRNREAG